MGTRTVLLDDEAEMTLERLRGLTGLPIPQVLKEGLAALEIQALQQSKRKPYDIYRDLDPGEGGVKGAMPVRQPARPSPR